MTTILDINSDRCLPHALSGPGRSPGEPHRRPRDSTATEGHPLVGLADEVVQRIFEVGVALACGTPLHQGDARLIALLDALEDFAGHVRDMGFGDGRDGRPRRTVGRDASGVLHSLDDATGSSDCGLIGFVTAQTDDWLSARGPRCSRCEVRTR